MLNVNIVRLSKPIYYEKLKKWVMIVKYKYNDKIGMTRIIRNTKTELIKIRLNDQIEI